MEGSVSSSDRMSLSNLLGKIFCFLLAFERKQHLFFSLQSQTVIQNKPIPTPLEWPEDSSKSTHLLPGLVMASPRRSGL